MNKWADLNHKEISISLIASGVLGFEVLMFQDGQWICQPRKIEYYNGYGATPEEAMKDCKERNAK